MRMHWSVVVASSLVVVGCTKQHSPPRATRAADPPSTATPGSSERLDTAQIEQRTGAKGTLSEKEGVFKVSVPRSDLAVTVAGGVRLTPPMGLTAWASFQRVGDQAMVMGDIVLTEDQVTPVLSVALDSGLEVTALHNHFLWESPRILFMHIGGMADEATLATAVGKVFARVRETAGGKGEHPARLAIDPVNSQLDRSKLDAILGVTGDYKDGVYKATFGRTTTMHGVEVGNAMGVNTWAAFAGTDDAAVVDGDFAMLESELQSVLETLRKANLQIVAIHQHMTGEQPRILFLHFWGTGRSVELAKGIKAALDTQAK